MLTDEAKEIALAAVFKEPLEVLLLRDGAEITDPGYKRQRLFVAPPGAVGGVIGVTNVTDVVFGPWFEGAKAVTAWAVRTVNGPVLAQAEFEEAETPRRGGELVLRPGDLLLGLV